MVFGQMESLVKYFQNVEEKAQSRMNVLQQNQYGWCTEKGNGEGIGL